MIAGQTKILSQHTVSVENLLDRRSNGSFEPPSKMLHHIAVPLVILKFKLYYLSKLLSDLTQMLIKANINSHNIQIFKFFKVKP